MTTDNLEIETLKQRAHTLSRALFLHLDEYIEDFPTGTPQQLIELIKQITIETDKTIQITTDLKKLSLICRSINTLASAMMILLDHAHTAQTPRGLAQFLDKLQMALNKDSKILVTPLADYNYTISNYYPGLDQLLSGTLIPEKNWEVISEPFCNGLNVVRFPRVERNNVLLHAIFGHEFGHPIAAEFLNTYQKSTEYSQDLTKLNEQVTIEFKSTFDLETDKVKRTKMHSELCTIAEEVHRRALEELISDSVAVMLFGASALFAAAEIMIPDGLDILPQHDDFYPPSRYRLRIMYNYLAQSGQIEALRSLNVHNDIKPIITALINYIDYIEKQVLDQSDLDTIKSHSLVKISYDWLEQTLPRGLLYARETVQEYIFQAITQTNQVPEALHRIYLGVPPNENGIHPNITSVDWRTPIIAGWIYKLFVTTNKEKSWNLKRDSVAEIQALSLKGVEDALLRLDYSNHSLS
ncbi:MAG: hypothetical protein ABW152_10355 [Candidatus Thiodiazotropha endolucinida]